MRLLKMLLAVLLVVTIAIIGMRLVFPLPELPDEAVSTQIPPNMDTRLGSALMSAAQNHAGKSGIYPLADGRDALVARILLARAAENSIDVQYYIWQADTTGWMVLDELRAAAERGVRVRLLLDDNGIPGLDNVLAGLNEMPNVEVRLFNPFTLRTPKLASYLFDFPRLNRRMHNKSMTVDGVATVIGGRNIGDIYFAYGEGVVYFDLDVLAAGPAAAEIAGDFDRYWASESAYPAELVLSPSHAGIEDLRDAAKAARESAKASDYVSAISSSPIVERLVAGQLDLEWTDLTLISDDPAKGLGKATDDELLIGRLGALLSLPETSLDLVSAYLIPGERGTKLLKSYLADGIKVRLMTNSLEATDVPLVHSGWMKYRDDLVRAGAQVLELRARPEIGETTSLAQLIGGSASSLHAKTFAVDENRIFIGSFNFDPRSASLNTEMGLLIDSPDIASSLARALDRSQTMYEVKIDPDGKLIWIEDHGNGDTLIYDEEPHTTAFKRGLVRIMSWLPIDWLL